MRILVLGAGALGGYFGAMLAQAGAEITFLVRPRRKAELEAHGLVVKTAAGDITVKPKLILADDSERPVDIVLLSCKSYDLDDAIAAIRPFMGEDSAVVPVLNGLAHIDRLAAALGRERVMGGMAVISATLEGPAIRLVGQASNLTFGELSGALSRRAQNFAAAFAGTPVKANVSTDIIQAMWDKLAMLASLAAATTLTRSSVGEIVALPDGEAFMLATLAECVGVATAEGHRPADAVLGQIRGMLTAKGSPFAASTMRDLVAGRRTEGDHIVGDLVRRAEARGIAVPILTTAILNLRAHEARLAKG